MSSAKEYSPFNFYALLFVWYMFLSFNYNNILTFEMRRDIAISHQRQDNDTECCCCCCCWWWWWWWRWWDCVTRRFTRQPGHYHVVIAALSLRATTRWSRAYSSSIATVYSSRWSHSDTLPACPAADCITCTNVLACAHCTQPKHCSAVNLVSKIAIFV